MSEVHFGGVQAPDALRPGGVAHEEVFHLLLADEGEAAFQRFEGIAFGCLAVAAPVRDAGQQGRSGLLRHVESSGVRPATGPACRSSSWASVRSPTMCA